MLIWCCDGAVTFMVFAYPLHLIVRTKLQTNQLYKEHFTKYLSNLLQGPAFNSSGNWRHCRESALLDRQSDTWGLFVGQSIVLHFIILFYRLFDSILFLLCFVLLSWCFPSSFFSAGLFLTYSFFPCSLYTPAKFFK